MGDITLHEFLKHIDTRRRRFVERMAAESHETAELSYSEWYAMWEAAFAEDCASVLPRVAKNREQGGDK